MNQLHPGARWIFRLNTYSRFGLLFIFGIWFMTLSRISYMIEDQLMDYVKYMILIFISLVIFVLIIGEIYARMAYNRWLYEITREGIKIEHGIIWKKYTSIPYERVQNVDIRRGILARMLGFSTVEIETAGQSGAGSYYRYGRRRQYKSEGHLPAIDIIGAEKIREFVMRTIKQVHSEAGI